MTDELILTNSEAQDFLDCRRRWYLAVYRKLGRPDEVRYNSSQSIGSMYHAGLAAYYNFGQSPADYARKAYADAILDLQATFGDNELALASHMAALEKEMSLVITMLEGYELYLQDEAPDEDLEVLGAEEKIEVPLTDGINLRGKIDAPARWKANPEIILQLEHKTVGNFTDLPKTAQANPQFLTYDLMSYLRTLFEKTGQRIDGIIINMAKKVKRTVKANPPFFKRHEVRHNEEELRNHWKHLVGIGREIQRTRERLDAGEDHHIVAPPRPSRDCSWKCPFAGPCLSGMIDDGSDFEGYVKANYAERDPLERYEEKEKVYDAEELGL